MRKEDEKGISETILASLSDMIVNEEDTFALSFPGLEIDSKRQIVQKNGETIQLNRQEFQALFYLAKYPGWVFTKEQIYEKVYGEKMMENIDDSIYHIICNLRKKIEKDIRNPQYVITVRGVGYKFAIPEE
ncbi:MAG: winged helix-turn-helix domain-containing protein [Lachnospiraceae bacterium]